MTQENKELLLRDLCARLPYHPILNWKFIDNTSKDEELKELSDLYIWWITKAQDCEVKPYLRPMSSITEEESKEYRMFIDYSYNDFTSESTPCVYVDKINDYLDWLNKKMFAYRTIDGKDMFELGIALKAPDGMYEKKK